MKQFVNRLIVLAILVLQPAGATVLDHACEHGATMDHHAMPCCDTEPAPMRACTDGCPGDCLALSSSWLTELERPVALQPSKTAKLSLGIGLDPPSIGRPPLLRPPIHS